jgi:hypothetical protein
MEVNNHYGLLLYVPFFIHLSQFEENQGRFGVFQIDLVKNVSDPWAVHGSKQSLWSFALRAILYASHAIRIAILCRPISSTCALDFQIT